MEGQTPHGPLISAVCALDLVGAPATSASRTGDPARTEAAYRAQANAICSTENREIGALPSGVTLVLYPTDALKIAHRAYAAMTRVAPPSGLAPLSTRVPANIAAGFPIVSRLLDRAKAGQLSLAQFEHDKTLGANVAEEDALWRRLGATVCANS